MRKIYLEGQLGQKFGNSHLFCGEAPADAFRLIESNYPNFKKYILECFKKDIAFHVEVNNEEINAAECFLPLTNGDIVVTPLPAGSKSGNAKIAASVVLFALGQGWAASIANTTAATATNVALMQGASSAAAAQAGASAAAALATPFLTKVAYALATNLAMTGIQQIMAPDPSTDSEQEGYLFTGEGRRTVEGSPVPVLYGELRIPGSQVSLEVGAGYNYKTGTQAGVDRSLNLVYRIMGSAATEISGPGGFNGVVERPSFTGQSQNIIATHVISEGEIYGLVDRERSVYLNNDPAVSLVAPNTDTEQADNEPAGAPIKVTVDKEFATATAKFTYTTTTQSAGYNAYGGEQYNVVLDTVTLTSTSIDLSSYTYTPNTYPQYKIIMTLPNGRDTEPFTITGGTSSSVSVTIPSEIKYNWYALADATVTRTFKIWKYTEDSTDDPPTKDTDKKVSGDISGLLNSAKYQNFGLEFRTGTLGQTPLISFDGEGIGNSAVTKTLNQQIAGPSDGSITNVRTYLYSDLDLSVEQATEVDEVRFLFAYDSLINYDENGGKRPGKAWYDFDIAFSEDAGSTYGNWHTVIDERRHYATSNSRFTIQDVVNVEKARLEHNYKTNSVWKIRITRHTENNIAYEEERTRQNSKYTGQSSCTIVSASSIIKEFLTFPHTSVAKVQFNSKDFQSMPDISYQCRGMLVKVPSNYVTREENEELNGYVQNGVYPAMYNRDSSGTPVYDSVDSTPDYQDWTGGFRSEKVYTNNPAWVFYDILTNNRYGLGNWISESDIDKYALYRIARYCDELVPDGSGGYEPRFTTNVYFTSFMDAYKTIKDLATVFRGMLYWMDGEIFSVMDQASDPVYNFSNVNVIDGLFSYESTGNRVRPNQVGVTWNNPVTNYKPEVLLIEDGEDIAKTGKINYEEAVAFGATTEGQALRYGRWKLWTAKNQTELVSFKTSINAAFLQPGDVINIQDHYKRPPYSVQSGRVSSTSTTPTTTSIPLDRDLILDTGTYDYELSILIETPGTFCSQTSAVIDTVTYTMGDLILTDRNGNPITTEAAASNLTDDNDDVVQTVWKPYTRVESRPITNSSGNNVRTLTVGTAFSAAPQEESVWALRTLLDTTEVEVLGSAQEYKILSISQESAADYVISAVRHYNEKFDSIDNEFTLTVQDPVFPLEPRYVPAPDNLYVVPTKLDNDSLRNDIVLSWDTPVDSNGDTFTQLSHYILTKPQTTDPAREMLKEYMSALGASFGDIIGKEETTVTIRNMPNGTYGFAIQAVSTTGRRSEKRFGYVTISDPIEETKAKRRRGVVIGGISTSDIGIVDVSSTKHFQFVNPEYTFVPSGATEIEIEGVSGTAATYQQQISNIAQIALSTWQGYTPKEKIDNAHFILMKYDDSSDPIKLVKWNNDTALGISYFYDAGTGNGTASSYFSAASGTATLAANSNRLVGTSTSFTTEFEIGDYVKLSATQVAKVSYISSNTVMFLETSYTAAITGATIYYPTLRIDKNNDALIAGIVNLSSGWKLIPLPDFTVISDPERDGRAALLIPDIPNIRFNSSGSVINSSTDITLTASGLGFTSPTFKITGAGFNNSEVSESAETTFSDPNFGTTGYTLNIGSNISTYDEDGLEFTLTVKEKNNDTTATQNIVIPMLEDGATGATGATGAAGTNGDDGARNAIAYYFYSTAQSGAPSTPSSSIFSYNFSTSTPSSSSGSWLTTFNPSALSSSNTGDNKYWAIRVTFQEATFGGSVGVTLSSVFTWTNFDGLVTFTNLANGRDENGNLSTTLIDGGAITANTINVDSLKSNSAGNSSTFEFNTSGVDFGFGSTISTTGYITSGTSNSIAYVGEATGSSQYGIGGIGNASGAGGVFHNSTNSDSYILLGHSSYAIRMQDGDLNFQLDYTGNLWTDGNVTAYAGLGSSSDIRLKDNIEPISYALNKIQTLRGVTFDFKKTGERSTGLIAQEVERVLPEAVYEAGEFENPEEKMKAVKYGNLAGLFVEAIKELQGEILELKSEVKRLKNGSSNS